jgi:predicted HTH transcriptional regulator
MIELCLAVGLPEPQFEQRSGSFVLTLWRDWLTDQVLNELDLNDRQRRALAYLKMNGKISNTEYQRVAHAIKKTATRDLNDLKLKGVLEQIGSRGAGVHYILAKKRDKMGTMGT